MRFYFLFILFAFGLKGLSQTSCNCIVKLTERELKLRNALQVEGANDYYKIKPQAPKKFSTHKIIKDSAAFWIVKPYITERSGSKPLSVHKSSQILCTIIQFNGADSIPLYEEPRKDSRIIKYIRDRSKQPVTDRDRENGFDNNDHWFAGCKGDFVKLNISGAFSGWIAKENFLSDPPEQGK